MSLVDRNDPLIETNFALGSYEKIPARFPM